SRRLISCSKMMFTNIFIGALMVFIAADAVVEGQAIASVTEDEIRDILATRASATNVVDCLIEYVPGSCDRRLENIEQTLPSLIRNHFKCQPPACTSESQSNVRVFVRIMQNKYPGLWRRLITNARRK
ncbi:unnamed protein product, partial [Meganyctiphanes norvegica]